MLWRILRPLQAPKYLPNLLSAPISELQEKMSVFGETEVDKLASAAIDRIVHHGRLVEFGGESRRMESSLMLGKAE